MVYKTVNEDFQKEFYSVKELAQVLGVSPNTIKNLMRSGELDYYRIGAQVRIPAGQMAKFKNVPQELSGVQYTSNLPPKKNAGQDFRGPEEYEDKPKQGPAASEDNSQ